MYPSGSNVPLVAQCRPLCTISSSRQEKAVKAAGAGAALHSYRGPGAGAGVGPLLLLTTGAAQLVINTTTARSYLAFSTCTCNYFPLSIFPSFILSAMMLYCIITISRTEHCTTALPPVTPALTYSLQSVSRPLEATDFQGIKTLVSVPCRVCCTVQCSVMQCNAVQHGNLTH